jgi:MFS transporter, UMF1 family
VNKKQLFIWALYDFANSLIYINFILYFAQWIVVDAGLPDFWYNAIFPITTIILLLTAPALAAHTDRHGDRKKYLNIATAGTFIAYGLAAILAGGHSNVWLVALTFLIGQYFYQLSFVFYNPMLVDIADESHRSRAFGIGQFASAIGFVVGIAMSLPLATSRTAPLLPAILAFIVLALPLMLFFKESFNSQENKTGSIKREAKVFIRKMIAFFAASVATPMLVAFFFFNDALLTISNNNAIYMERVFGTPDTTKSIMLMAVLVMSAIGGIVAGWLGDKIGVLKTLKFILIAWIIVIPLISLAPSFIFFAIVGSLGGLLIGSVWTVTRSYLTMVLPKDQLGYGFSFYALAERFATFVGPLTWGGIIWWLGTDATAYRIAMGSMAVFMIIGLIILVKWKRVDSHLIA